MTIWTFLLLLPLAILLYHAYRVTGTRPDAYRDISDRPTIPVVVVDIDMPFPSMVALMLKIAVAAMPAMAIMAVVFALVSVAVYAALGVGRSPW